MTRLPTALPLALLMVGAAIPGDATAAQMVCGERKQIVSELQRKYGETRRSIGLQQGRGVVEVYASDQTGSWSILLTNTAGRTCLIAAGEAFETETAQVAGTPA